MIMNLLFTAICLAFVFVVTADIQSARTREVRVSRREPRARRNVPADHLPR